MNRMRRANGKRSWMVYKGCDEEYAKQVTAEHKISEIGRASCRERV